MITPLGNKLGIAPIYDPDTSSTGAIIIPAEAKEKCDQGIVKYRGPLVSDEIQIGDHVSFSGYTGTTMRIGSGHGDYENDEIVIIVPEPFIVCKIQNAVTELPGLYFRHKSANADSRLDFCAMLAVRITKLAKLSDEMGQEVMNEIVEAFLRRDEEYFEATHEAVIDHIAWLITNDPTHREKFGIVNRASFKPKPSEYAGLR